MELKIMRFMNEAIEASSRAMESETDPFEGGTDPDEHLQMIVDTHNIAGSAWATVVDLAQRWRDIEFAKAKLARTNGVVDEDGYHVEN